MIHFEFDILSGWPFDWLLSVAKDTQMTKSNSITGECDYTLYDIVEQLVQ